MVLRSAAVRARLPARIARIAIGMSKPARRMMIPITTSNSTSVNPPGAVAGRKRFECVAGTDSLSDVAEAADVILGSIYAVRTGADEDEAVLLPNRTAGADEIGIGVVGVLRSE